MIPTVKEMTYDVHAYVVDNVSITHLNNIAYHSITHDDIFSPYTNSIKVHSLSLIVSSVYV